MRIDNMTKRDIQWFKKMDFEIEVKIEKKQKIEQEIDKMVKRFNFEIKKLSKNEQYDIAKTLGYLD